MKRGRESKERESRNRNDREAEGDGRRVHVKERRLMIVRVTKERLKRGHGGE